MRAADLRSETFSGWAKHVLAEAAEKQIREHEFTAMALADHHPNQHQRHLKQRGDIRSDSKIK